VYGRGPGEERFERYPVLTNLQVEFAVDRIGSPKFHVFIKDETETFFGTRRKAAERPTNVFYMAKSRMVCNLFPGLGTVHQAVSDCQDLPLVNRNFCFLKGPHFVFCGLKSKNKGKPNFACYFCLPGLELEHCRG
jgi:hypothetical protein